MQQSTKHPIGHTTSRAKILGGLLNVTLGVILVISVVWADLPPLILVGTFLALLGVAEIISIKHRILAHTLRLWARIGALASLVIFAGWAILD